MPTSLSAATIQRYLKGVKYPTNKKKLLFVAEQHDAPEDVLEMLREGLSEEDRYDSPAQVQEEVFGSEEDEGEERRGRNEATQDDEAVDRRLKGHETNRLYEARHMARGYDGRGRVRDPKHDHRLSGQETPELYEARHMARGYDGRGRVRKRPEGEVDTKKRFEGNEAATGGNRRKPQYQMSREERQRRNRERLEQLHRRPSSHATDPKQMIWDYLQDNEEADFNSIHDFAEDNEIEDIGDILRDMREEGSIRKTKDGAYVVNR